MSSALRAVVQPEQYAALLYLWAHRGGLDVTEKRPTRVAKAIYGADSVRAVDPDELGRGGPYAGRINGRQFFVVPEGLVGPWLQEAIATLLAHLVIDGFSFVPNDDFYPLRDRVAGVLLDRDPVTREWRQMGAIAPVGAEA